MARLCRDGGRERPKKKGGKIIDYITQEKKRAEDEMYVALNPKKNKNTSLAPGTNTGYNKKNGGSYTGSTTGFETKKSPLKTKTDFTAPKQKTTVYTPDIPKTRPPKSPDYFQTARKTQKNLNKPLPRIDDAPKDNTLEITRKLKKKYGNPYDTKVGNTLNTGKENTFNDFSKKFNLPSREERNFATGAFGEDAERQSYNDGVVEEFRNLGYLKNTKTQDDLFREGFTGVEKPDVYEFTPKADDNVKRSFYDFLDLGKTYESRMEAFAKIRDNTTTQNAQDEINYPWTTVFGNGLNYTRVPNTSSNTFKSVLKDAAENFGAHANLNNTAYKQYPWMRYASTLSPVAGKLVNDRITSSSIRVAKNKDIINAVANRHKVPKEIIGGIIFKEQLTQSLPDTLANVHTFIAGDGNTHSTGLGAIFPETARAAWGVVDKEKVLPKSDKELQIRLTHDRQFNIETIAAVLIYEAINKQIISDVSEASNLTTEQWWKAVAKYNGSDEYARKVYEYLPYVTELLD